MRFSPTSTPADAAAPRELDGPSIAGVQLQRVQVTERRVALARLMLVISGFILYPMVDGRPGTHTALAWTLLCGAVPYAVFAVVYQPAPRDRPIVLSYATSTLDTFFVMLWLWATGGYESPFFIAIYIGMVSNAVRYSMSGTLFAAVAYGIGYSVLFGLSDLDPALAYPDFAVRIAYMGMAAITGVVVTGSIQDAVRAQFDSETRARNEQLEARLARAERMAALGTLASGVAHEINNPLTYVMTNLELVREEAEELGRGDLIDMLEEAQEGSVRIRRIVSDLKSFSRERPATGAAARLDEVLKSAISMGRHQAKHRARVVESFCALPPVKGDRICGPLVPTTSWSRSRSIIRLRTTDSRYAEV